MALPDLSLVVDEDTPLSSAVLLSNDSDADGDLLSALPVASPTNGSLTLNADGSIDSYVPNANFVGTDSFSYKATDGALESDVVDVSITVNPVNDTPVAYDDLFFSTDEDTTLAIYPNQLLGNDSDLEGDVLSLGPIGSAASGTVVVNDNGTPADGSDDWLEFTPASNFAGDATFTYQASDGMALSLAANVTIAVYAVNDAPVAVADSLTATEDTTLNITRDDLLGTDADNDEDPDNADATLNIFVEIFPCMGTLTENPDGTFDYVPNTDYFGLDEFSYYVGDTTGAYSDIVTVTIDIAPVADDPTTTGIPALELPYAPEDIELDLWQFFDDAEDGPDLTYAVTVTETNNPSLFTSMPIPDADDFLMLGAASGAAGWAILKVEATDSNGGTVFTTFAVTTRKPKVWISDIKHTGETATPGFFVIERVGDLGQALAVSYSLAGTATLSTAPGSGDYSGPAALSGALTFAPSQSTLTVSIAPADDSVGEPNHENVILTLSPSTTYQLANPYDDDPTDNEPSFGPASATITLHDNDSGAVVWVSHVKHTSEGAPSPSEDGEFLLETVGEVGLFEDGSGASVPAPPGGWYQYVAPTGTLQLMDPQPGEGPDVIFDLCGTATLDVDSSGDDDYSGPLSATRVTSLGAVTSSTGESCQRLRALMATGVPLSIPIRARADGVTENAEKARLQLQGPLTGSDTWLWPSDSTGLLYGTLREGAYAVGNPASDSVKLADTPAAACSVAPPPTTGSSGGTGSSAATVSAPFEPALIDAGWFITANAIVSEREGVARIILYLAEENLAAQFFMVELVDGSASKSQNGVRFDYEDISQQMTVPTGDLNIMLSVPINDDDEDESDSETFYLRVTDAAGITAIATIEIIDDDGVPNCSPALAANPKWVEVRAGKGRLWEAAEDGADLMSLAEAITGDRRDWVSIFPARGKDTNKDEWDNYPVAKKGAIASVKALLKADQGPVLLVVQKKDGIQPGTAPDVYLRDSKALIDKDLKAGKVKFITMEFSTYQSLANVIRETSSDGYAPIASTYIVHHWSATPTETPNLDMFFKAGADGINANNKWDNNTNTLEIARKKRFPPRSWFAASGEVVSWGCHTEKVAEAIAKLLLRRGAAARGTTKNLYVRHDLGVFSAGFDTNTNNFLDANERATTISGVLAFPFWSSYDGKL